MRRVVGLEFVALAQDIVRAAIPGHIRFPPPGNVDVRPPPPFRWPGGGAERRRRERAGRCRFAGGD
eukprot:4688040-Alexandrium_andersonii.AAC.1